MKIGTEMLCRQLSRTVNMTLDVCGVANGQSVVCLRSSLQLMASVEVMQLPELADLIRLCSEITSLTESTGFRRHLFVPYVAGTTCFAVCTPRVYTQQFSARFLHLHFQFRLIVLFLVVPSPSGPTKQEYGRWVGLCSATVCRYMGHRGRSGATLAN